jgi:hypothetical protein
MDPATRSMAKFMGEEGGLVGKLTTCMAHIFNLLITVLRRSERLVKLLGQT